MKYRTDLAMENLKSLENSGIQPGEQDGILIQQEQIEDNIKVTTVDIKELKGEAILGKPMGRYVTVEIDHLMEEEDSLRDRAARALSAELAKMVSHDYYRRVLVIGLGNEKVTPDSLGPATVAKVKVTSHLFRLFGCDGDEELSNVSGLTPGVTAATGIETADLIQKAVELTKADTVIAIDALAARDIKRVSTTIQISDTGIAPGAGIGNMRKKLNQETLGIKVIAIGVPTVIDSQTLLLEAAEAMNLPDEKIHEYLKSKELDMVVTSTDIDFVIRVFSDIIAKAINITLHPGIYS